MFREKYRKDNEQILASAELVDRTKTKMMMADRGINKRYIFQGAIAITATAAVVCLCMFGDFIPKVDNNVTTPPIQTAVFENVFTLTAYAAELVPDGTLNSQKQLEFAQAVADEEPRLSIAVSERVDGVEGRIFSVYKNIAFKCEGSNIKSVTFTVDEGYFSKMDVGQPLERIGESYIMDEQDLGSMIYWGIDIPGEMEKLNDNGEISYTFGGERKSFQNINVKAVATFDDGETQEKSIVYDTEKGTLVLSEK